MSKLTGTDKNHEGFFDFWKELSDNDQFEEWSDEWRSMTKNQKGKTFQKKGPILQKYCDILVQCDGPGHGAHLWTWRWFIKSLKFKQ